MRGPPNAPPKQGREARGRAAHAVQYRSVVADAGSVTVGTPRESFPRETRVALTPSSVRSLRERNVEVVVEAGAGEPAGFPDAGYVEHGARIVSGDEAFGAHLVVRVRLVGPAGDALDAERMRPGQVVVGLVDPLDSPAASRAIAERGATLFALDLVPRIARAQAMDVLSSQATVAGYRAAIIAAERLPKMFPMLITAAGNVPAARVLVVGAGVAGLHAIATARRLGALVEAYDVRPAAREEVESLGARFVELGLQPGDAEGAGGYAKSLDESFYLRQQELLARVAAGSDVVICAALIPGRPAPMLLTKDALAGMAPGSVVVDAAAERGGNCELTRPGEEVVSDHGVTILGPTNLPAEIPHEASLMFARNAAAFLGLLLAGGTLAVDADDEIVRETLVARNGEVVHPKMREREVVPS